ncbi:transposase [Sedimentibacter saalensis]|uniref:transposase n=1 Tax=Sedimentibacter saalensis TaxID=130788 RepID=UPI0011A33A9F
MTREIFKAGIDKNMAMAIIKGIMKDIDYSIITYCIMDNHLHLLMKVYYDKLEI